MNQLEAVKVLGQQIRQLSAAAACAQVEMSTVRPQVRGEPRRDEAPLELLDRLANSLAEPALKALIVVELAIAPAQPTQQNREIHDRAKSTN